MSHRDLVERLEDQADLCRAETATDLAELLDEAAAEIARLRSRADPGTVVDDIMGALPPLPPDFDRALLESFIARRVFAAAGRVR